MRIGGKASSLQKLRKAGFTVPSFIICDPEWDSERILTAVREHLPGVQHFAVRSSADQEDSQTKSFAGAFYSAIGVDFADISKEVVRVKDSYAGRSGAVIIQEFVPSDSAGVLFTETEDKRVVINAIPGLCFPVVNGEACDEYICSTDGALLTKTLPEKNAAFFREGTFVREKRSSQTLSVAQVKQLVLLGEQLQRFFRCPQDIEWCFKDEALYLLQSRPITKKVVLAEESYFDSANIAESYSGIVLPLTCSFASMVYEQVYKDLLAASGISRKKVEANKGIFENLLGFFYGRMYYNMNNWYRMAEFAPGYRRNKQNFERMITSNVRQEFEKKIKPHWLFTIAYPWIIGFKIITFSHACRHFMERTAHHLRYLREQDFGSLSYSDCISLFETFNKELLRRWYVTVENDFFVMTYLGMLSKRLNDQELQKAITFPSKATEQIQALALLSKKIAAVKELWDIVNSHDDRHFMTELKRYPELDSALQKYLETFGGRFANELKLESVGIDEDPKKLLILLKVYRGYEHTEPPIDAVEAVRSRSIPIRLLLAGFKKHAARREEFRLLRSNTFAMVRRLFRRMGSILAKQGLINDPDDVFYLQLDELLSPAVLSNSELRDIVSKRKGAYESFAQVMPPAHFSTTNSEAPIVEGNETIPNKAGLQGRPASPGKVAGIAKVFKEFSMPEKIDFDIIVTSHTDPGWTSLIALSKGLIIEHGGVLSHASIVARELGIPAVIGVQNAMQIIEDGQKIEIDGSTGMVTFK